MTDTTTVTHPVADRLLQAAEFYDESALWSAKRLGDLIRRLVELHPPGKVWHVDSIDCPEHSYKVNPKLWHRGGAPDREALEACPVCEVTYRDRCGSWHCDSSDGYPCATVQAVVDALGLEGAA